MKQLFTLMIIATLASCQNGKKPSTFTKAEPMNQSIIIGVVTKRDGSKKISEVLRIVRDQIVQEGKNKVIVTDTIYGEWVVFPVLDALKKPIKKINGQDSVYGSWILIGRDSLSTRIENIPIDSLLKKN